MQYSDYEYQPFAPRPDNRIVKFGWIGEAWDIYRQGFFPWLALNLMFATPVLLTLLGIGLAIRAFSNQDSNSGSDSASSSSSDPGIAGDISMALFFGGMLLAVLVLGLIVSSCSSGIALRQVRGESVRPGQIFAGMDRWIPLFILSIILAPTLAFASLLLGLGLFVACGLLLPAFAVVADGENAMRAFSKSVAVMKSDWLRATLFCLLYAVIAAIGTAVTLGLGVLVVVPMAYILSAIAHRDALTVSSRTPIDYLSGPAHGVWPPAPTVPIQPLNQQPGSSQPGPPGQGS